MALRLGRECRHVVLAIAKNLFDHLEILFIIASCYTIRLKPFSLVLVRGSGLQGIDAMQQQSVLFGMRILRPLLGFTRTELEGYAQRKNSTGLQMKVMRITDTIVISYAMKFCQNYVHAGLILISRATFRTTLF